MTTMHARRRDENRRTRPTRRTRGRESLKREGRDGGVACVWCGALEGRRDRKGGRTKGESWAVSQAQSSSASAKDTEEEGMEEKGASVASSFIRGHLRELAPYTPILPFEVLSEKVRTERERERERETCTHRWPSIMCSALLWLSFFDCANLCG